MNRFGSEGEDIIGRWSEDKLDLLAKYLKAYSVIMNEQKKKWLSAYYYIDAFAGSVSPRAKDDERRYIDGSPIRALLTEPRFDGYWFVDLSPKRIERVERLREEYPNCTIEIQQGNCNEVLRNDIIPKLPYSSKKRALASLYTTQLKSLFPYVSNPALMRNSTNSALYALCLASHNETAIKITNNIFDRHEQLRSV